MTQSLRQSFLAGLLALLPLFITWRIILALFEMVDGVLGNHIDGWLSVAAGSPIHIPGLGLMVTVLLVLGVGYLTRKVFFKQALAGFETIIGRVPVVRSLYSATRQIVSPFAEDAKLPFSQVVLAEYPMVGRQTLGLVAKERITDDPNDDRMVVFFPSNHLHLGYPVLLSRHDVVYIDMSVEEAVKFFVSCGVIGDDKIIRSNGEIIPSGAAPR